MGKHGRRKGDSEPTRQPAGKDWNKAPFSTSTPAEIKGREFDAQYESNRKDTNTPNLDAYEKRKK
jgi:hypothetical protein